MNISKPMGAASATEMILSHNVSSNEEIDAMMTQA